MNGKESRTRALAIGGTVLVWLPLLAPFLLGLVVYLAEGVFHFDFLMPLELFSMVAVGGGLLLWAAVRERTRLAPIARGLVLAIATLAGGQMVAVATGLASGDTALRSWPGLFVLALLVAYNVAVVMMGVAGTLLIRQLFRKRLGLLL